MMSVVHWSRERGQPGRQAAPGIPCCGFAPASPSLKRKGGRWLRARSAMFGPYEPPASLCSASPFCSAKRGGFAAAPPRPRAYPGRWRCLRHLAPLSLVSWALRKGRATARVASTVWSREGSVPLRTPRLGVGANRVRRLPGCQQGSQRCDQCGSLPLDRVRLF